MKKDFRARAKKSTAGASGYKTRFLIDGSGSMWGPKYEGACAAAIAAASNNEDVSIMPWSDEADVEISSSNPKMLARALKNIQQRGGSLLVPALHALNKTGHSQHIIIISDGDIYEKNAVAEMDKFLSGNKKSSVDVILVGNDSRGTFLADANGGELQHSRYRTHHVHDPKDASVVAELIIELEKERHLRLELENVAHAKKKKPQSGQHKKR